MQAQGRTPRRNTRRRIPEGLSAGEAASLAVERRLPTKSSRVNWEALQVKITSKIYFS